VIETRTPADEINLLRTDALSVRPSIDVLAIVAMASRTALDSPNSANMTLDIWAAKERWGPAPAIAKL